MQTQQEDQKNGGQGARDRLASILGILRLPQQEVAERLEVSPQYLSAVKRGERAVSPGLALSLEEIFGIRASWLMRGEGQWIADEDTAAEFVPNFLLRSSGSAGRRPSDDMAVGSDAKLHSLRQPLLRDTTAMPLIDKPVEKLPRRSPDYADHCLEVPDTNSRRLYCIPARQEHAPAFQPGEYIMLEYRPPMEWSMDEVDGRVCAARPAGASAVDLYRVRVQPLEQNGGPNRRRVVLQPAGGGEARRSDWSRASIFGVVRMVLRLPQPECPGSEEADSDRNSDSLFDSGNGQ